MSINVTELIKLYLCDPQPPLACQLIDIKSTKAAAVSFGDMYTADTIASMAVAEGLETWINCHGNWVVEGKGIKGSFILRELPNGYVELAARTATNLTDKD